MRHLARQTEPWKGRTNNEAQGVIKSVLQILANSYDSGSVFACAIHTDSYPKANAVEPASEDLTSRFDKFLTRLRNDGDRQCGMVSLHRTVHDAPL